MDKYAILGYLAIVSVPLAPAVFFGNRVYAGILSAGVPAWLAVVVGVAGGFGLEVVGILAGHVATDRWRHEDRARAGVAAAIMLAYVAIGVYELRGTIGVAMFLIAPLVYLLIALQDDARREGRQEQQTEREERTYSRQVARWERQQEMELKRLGMEQKHAEKLARIEAKARQKQAAETRQDAGQDTGNMPADWRQLTDRQISTLAHATREERERMFPDIAGRTRRAWHNRLDEVATKNGSA